MEIATYLQSLMICKENLECSISVAFDFLHLNVKEADKTNGEGFKSTKIELFTFASLISVILNHSNILHDSFSIIFSKFVA